MWKKKEMKNFVFKCLIYIQVTGQIKGKKLISNGLYWKLREISSMRMRIFRKQISENQLNLGLQSCDLSSFVDLICLSFSFSHLFYNKQEFFNSIHWNWKVNFTLRKTKFSIFEAKQALIFNIHIQYINESSSEMVEIK